MTPIFVISENHRLPSLPAAMLLAAKVRPVNSVIVAVDAGRTVAVTVETPLAFVVPLVTVMLTVDFPPAG